jgi:hypothetical protein
MPRCPNLLDAETRGEFNRAITRMGGRALAEEDVRRRAPYLQALTLAERTAYDRAHFLLDQAEGRIEGVHSYLDLEEQVRAGLGMAPLVESSRPAQGAASETNRDFVADAQAIPTEAFRERLDEANAALRRELERMLPAGVALKLADRVMHRGEEYAGSYNPLPGIVSVALAYGPRFARVAGFHEVAAHALRAAPGEDGLLHSLYTREEWRILLERAYKVGAQDALNPPIPGMPAIEGYRQIYTQGLRETGWSGGSLLRRLNEYLDQEQVGALAEQWAAGSDFGSKVNGLLARILKFLGAIRNALRGLGFQTYEDVFRRVKSGEVAARAGTAAAGEVTGVRDPGSVAWAAGRGQAEALARLERERGAEPLRAAALPERMTREALSDLADRAPSMSPQEARAALDWMNRQMERKMQEGGRIARHCMTRPAGFSIRA